MSLPQVAKKYGRSTTAVIVALKKKGLKTRSIKEANEIDSYKINDKYFEKVDTFAKAQIVGFLYADGCLTKVNKYSRILATNIHKKDIDYLDWMKSELSAEAPICEHNDMRILSICNQKICNDAEKLGVKERKSLCLGFPTIEQIPEVFYPSFLLGFFEGDGCIYFKIKNNKMRVKVSICCTLEFSAILQSIFLNIGIKSKLNRKKADRLSNKNAYTVDICSGPQIAKFYDWLYKNESGFKMNRKYLKMKELRSLYDENYKFIKTDEWTRNRSEKISKSITGRKFSEESRKKMRKSAQLREEKKKISKSI